MLVHYVHMYLHFCQEYYYFFHNHMKYLALIYYFVLYATLDYAKELLQID